MYLGKIAQRWVNEPLEAFDEDSGTFLPDAMVGKISLVDRFLSNFNRPLRRRMLHYSPATQLPESLTVRNPSTGEIYIVGQERSDSDNGTMYHKMSVCQLVTDEGGVGSSGLATVYRSAPEGPEDNPGWLVRTAIAQHYADFEFRTTLNESGLEDNKIETYLLWMQQNADLKKYDFVEMHGESYRVIGQYYDSGFVMAWADQEPDYRIDVVFEFGSDPVYDPDTGGFSETPQAYNVTVSLEEDTSSANWVSGSGGTLDLFVQEDHIGFEPEPGMSVKYEEVTRTITEVTHFRGERQYKIRCE